MIISKLQQRDLDALAVLYPDLDFESEYLEHLQDNRHILVGGDKDEDGIRSYHGFVSILWESDYTLFWRHKIPEIIKLYVVNNPHRWSIGSGLITAIEVAARKKGFHKIGVRLERVGEFAPNFYQALGYTENIFQEKDKSSLIKILA